MGSTYSSLHYHLVFSTKDRRPMIADAWGERLHSYLGGIVRAAGGTPTKIGGVADHVHLLVQLKPTHQLSGFLRNLKSESSGWVHREIGHLGFAWQDGYAAFTVSVSQLGAVRDYIATQAEHHRKRSFEEEFRELLARHDVEFDEKYLL